MGIFFIAGYHFIFNFVGSLAGWCCLYVLLSRIDVRTLPPNDFALADAALFALALLGLTGHLPQTTVGVMESFGSLAAKAAKKLGE